MILFRPICFSVVLGVFASPACAALEQNTSETPITTLKANPRVVLLDVVVTDKQGNPVRDIRADDLKVFEDGKLQKLSSFALVDKASPAMAAPPAELGPGIYYNRQGLETQNGQFTVLLLDRPNTPLGQQFFVHQQILKYLENHKNDKQPIAIFELRNSLALLQDFTTNAALLRKALEKQDFTPDSSSQDEVAPDESQSVYTLGSAAGVSKAARLAANQRAKRVSITNQALNEISQWIAGVRGRKKLIWFSGSFPTGEMTPGNPKGVYFSEMDEALTSLSDNQVAVYPVNAGSSAGPDPTVYGVSTRLVGYVSEHDTMKQIAARTGGVAYYNPHEMADAAAKSIEDGLVYYLMSYSSENKNWNRGYRTVEVKTGRRGLQLRYRMGYFALDPLEAANQSRTFIKREMESALYSPVLATALPLYGSAQPIPAQGATKEDTAAMQPKGFHRRTLLPDEAVLSHNNTHPVNVGFLIQLSELSYEQLEANLRHYSLELFVGVFAGNKLVGHAEDSIDGNHKPEAFARMGSAGGVFHTTVQVPDEKVRLRLIVRDNRSGKIGALDVPYPNEVAAK